MTRNILLIVVFLHVVNLANTQIIWGGPDVIFTKEDDVDWLLSENQDSLTENVILTRGENKSLFNIAQETEYNEDTEWSPIDTEWAIGHSDTLLSLNFNTWKIANGGSIKPDIGEHLVVHLITDDIYIDLTYLSWSGGGHGGFSYSRSSPTVAHLEIDGSLQLMHLDTVSTSNLVIVANGDGLLGVQEFSFSAQRNLVPSIIENNESLANIKNTADRIGKSFINNDINLDIVGHIEIGQLDTISNSNHVLVLLPDSTVALRDISAMNTANVSEIQSREEHNRIAELSKDKLRIDKDSIDKDRIDKARSNKSPKRSLMSAGNSDIEGTMKFVPVDLVFLQDYALVVKPDGTIALQNIATFLKTAVVKKDAD